MAWSAWIDGTPKVPGYTILLLHIKHPKPGSFTPSVDNNKYHREYLKSYVYKTEYWAQCKCLQQHRTQTPSALAAMPW